MNSSIEASCKDLIERRMKKLYKNKGHKTDWLELRNLKCNNQEQMQNEIVRLIGDGDLEEGTTLEQYQSICDLMKEIEQEAEDCREAIGASIVHDANVDNNSVTKTEVRSAWVLYKKKLLEEKNFSEVSVNIIEKDTERIRKRLSTVYDPEVKAIKGMVVGAVQSGKTANMSALIAQCADNGWNCFIILGGMIENLRNQTEKRMLDDLSGQGNHKWTALSSVCNPKEEHGHRLDNLNLSGGSSDRYLCIALKQKDRLSNLIKWMKRDKANAKNLKVLIIDDEADQASVNTGDITKGEKKKIYDLIDQIVNGVGPQKEQLCGAMNYICYTATPYANFLNDSDMESLYPNNFIATLTPPKSYFGPQEIFGLDKEGYDGLSIIRNINKEDKVNIKDIYSETSDEMPKSLEEALVWFFCCVSAMRSLGRQKPYSMLINVSQKTDQHEVISNVIEKWFNSNSVDTIVKKAKYIWNLETKRFTKDTFASEFSTYENIEKIKDYPSFSSFEHELRLVVDYGIKQIVFNQEKNEFVYNNGIHLCVDNSKNNKINDNSEYSRLVYPSQKQLENLNAPAFIVIGGNTLSRGLTLEGLVSTYFLRIGRQADSLMQMGRWFGYRFGYELYPRIWMDENTEEQFSFISKLDYDLRLNLHEYMNLNLSPREVGPLINNTPAVSWLRITAKNKSQSVINATYDYTGIQAQTISFDDDISTMDFNVSHTMEFLNNLSMKAEKSRSKSSYVWKNVDVESILNFLGDFKFCANNRLFKDIPVFASWLKENQNETAMSKWNVVLAGIQDGNKWDLNENISINKVTRSKKIKIKDYINIGVLRSYKDNFEDIAFGELPSKESDIYEKIKSPKENSKKRKFFDFKKEIGFSVNPMLVLYVIDGKPKLSNNPQQRESLNLEQDLIGVYLAVPGEHKNRNSVSQVTVRIKEVEGNYHD